MRKDNKKALETEGFERPRVWSLLYPNGRSYSHLFCGFWWFLLRYRNFAAIIDLKI
jgi:hypothetical protein